MGLLLIPTLHIYGRAHGDNNTEEPKGCGRYTTSIWNYTYGGQSTDCCHSLQVTSDGGYILAGYSYSEKQTNSDGWLIKLDSEGKSTWEQTYGGSTDGFLYSVKHTIDNGYIVAGKIYYYSSDTSDGWLIKIDSEGEGQWQQILHGDKDDCILSVEETSDNDYALAGFTTSAGSGEEDIWLLKVNQDRDIVWENVWGGARLDQANAIIQTRDGGFATLFYYESFRHGSDDDWLYKIDSNGIKHWQRTYGGEKQDIPLTISQTDDGGFIIAGSTESFGVGGADVWLIRTDELGNHRWNTTFGGSLDDIGYAVQQTDDGGFIIAGSTESFGSGGADMWLIKTDQHGNHRWNTTFGGSLDDIGYAVQQSDDGNYVIAGCTESFGAGETDAWVIKLSANEPPYTPDVAGSTSSYQWVDTTYTVSATDTDDDSLQFYFDWGDGSGEWTNFVASGEALGVAHRWTDDGTFFVKVRAQDENGGKGPWTPPMRIDVIPNSRPDVPDTPSGSTAGILLKQYTYSTTCVDADGDRVQYGWDWDGDKTVDQWTSFYTSGDVVETSHAWNITGEYEITVIGMDDRGAYSDWSEALVVSMPLTYHPRLYIIECMVEWFLHTLVHFNYL
jgi:hypothetical protein